MADDRTPPSSSSSGKLSDPPTPHPKVVSFRRGSRESNEYNEQSPLLPAAQPSGDNDRLKVLSPLDDDSDWDAEQEETKSSWYMLLLTLGGFGLQMGWSVEMSNGSPYLLSLGLNKALLALVWIAGPLSGVIVQPYVGIKSDRCRNKLGKRRPFIIGGALATITSLMILAWTREIVGGFLSIFGADPASHGVAVCIMLFAVLFIYILDFAINVIQAGLRAYIVDCAPTHQQESANAWISRMSGIGNIFGMFCGGLNLPKVLPFLGNTQFKVLCAIASLSMAVTVGISCASVKERDPTKEAEDPNAQEDIISLFRGLWHAVFRLPPQISKVCTVQFMAWIGWFPFLFYSTTYIGEIYVEPYLTENPHMSEQEVNELWDRATRRGTVALLIFAVTTFVASVFLPFIVAPTFKQPITMQGPATPLTPTASAHNSSAGYFNAKSLSRKNTYWQRLQRITSATLSRIQIRSLTLRRAWFYSHIFFAACMGLTFLVRSVALATTVVGLVGIPWAITSWAPFALISAEISKRDAIRRGLVRAPPTQDGQLLAASEDDSADRAGVVLGIHNVAISAPQVIATLLSSLIFKILQKPRGTPGDESVAWCFRLGGLCALAAAYLTLRVGEDNADFVARAEQRVESVVT